MANADLAVYGTQLPRLVSANGVSIREDVLYTDAKGEPDQRRRKRAEDALADLQDVLPNLLEPKETILFVIKSCQAPMGALEQFFLGWYAYRVTATRLVFTNLRLLHFGLASGKQWNRTIKSVRWGDVAEAKSKGWLNRMLLILCTNGEKEKYWRLRRKDSQKAKAIVNAVLPLSRGEATPAQGFQSICPDCRAPLTEGHYQCAACGLQFRDEKTLRWRTVLIPGGGYLYAGMTFLGVLGFIEGLLTLGLIFSLLIALGVVAPGKAENGRPMQREEFWGAAIFLGVLVALHKGLEYIHCRRVIRNFMPMKRP
jgi:hypothetical protein